MTEVELKKFLQAGKEKEKQFAQLFKNTTVSSKEQDMKEHWDVQVNFKVDIKGLKKVRRSDNETNENIHWLEIIGITGHPGWLYSKETDLFAFETNEYWIVVTKKDLQGLVKEKVKKVYVQEPQLYKLYRRQDRKDLMTLVTSLDLCYICTSMIKKDGIQD